MRLQLDDQQRIRAWNQGIAEPLVIFLHIANDPRDFKLETFAEELEAVADRVRIERLDDSNRNIPAFQIGSGWFYQGVPEGNELQPFLGLLSCVAESSPTIPRSVREYLDEVVHPVHLKLYVAPQCVYCPHMVNALAPLPFCNAHISIDLVDVSTFPELAEAVGVKSVPTLMYGDSFRWTGTINVQEVLTVLSRQSSTELGSDALVRMLKEGDAVPLARMMLEAGKIFPGFVQVLIHPEWSVRLGAMVVLEQLAEEQPALPAAVLQPLWSLRSRMDLSQLGDLVYLIGEHGSGEWLPRLESMLEEDVPDELADAAGEAIGQLRERSLA